MSSFPLHVLGSTSEFRGSVPFDFRYVFEEFGVWFGEFKRFVFWVLTIIDMCCYGAVELRGLVLYGSSLFEFEDVSFS